MVIVWLSEFLPPMLLVPVGDMLLTYFAGFRMIVKAVASIAMLIIIAAVQWWLIGETSHAAVETLCDGLVQAALATAGAAGVFWWPQAGLAHDDAQAGAGAPKRRPSRDEEHPCTMISVCN